MKNDLISIIIPVYNVEKYLAKNIESVIRQTYRNIEVILINDGSTDNSGKICDEYAKIDKRIKVIHKSNGGLSDARNVGIDVANGQFITFCDSDDYLKESYIEYLYELIKKDKCKMSICSYCILTENEKMIDCGKGYNEGILTTEQTLSRMLCDEGFSVSACAKLYAKELFDDVRYPVGKLCEDNGTTYKLIKKCKLISYGNISQYIYIKRSGSIMNSKFNMKKLDLLELTNEMANELLEEYPNIKDAIERRVIYAKLSIIRQAINDDTSVKLVKKLRQEVIRDWKKILLNKKINSRDKAAFFILLLGKNAFRLSWNVYCKIKY